MKTTFTVYTVARSQAEATRFIADPESSRFGVFTFFGEKAAQMMLYDLSRNNEGMRVYPVTVIVEAGEPKP